MKRNIRLTTGILSLVLFGTLGLSLVANETTAASNISFETQSVEAKPTTTEDSDFSIEDANESTYSDANQAAIAADIDSHLATDGSGNAMNILFGSNEATYSSYFVASDSITYNNPNPISDIELNYDSINVENVFNEIGISEDTSLIDSIKLIKQFYENEDNWVNLFWSDVFSGTYNYEMSFNVDEIAHGNSMIYYGGFESDPNLSWKEFTTSSPGINPNGTYDGIWIGSDNGAVNNVTTRRFNPIELTYDEAFTPYYELNGDDFNFIEESNAIDFGYAKLLQTDPKTGEEKDVYARIDADILVSDAPTTKFQISDLEIGYSYELEDIYLAYSTYQSGSQSVENGIDGSGNYAYATLKGLDKDSDGSANPNSDPSYDNDGDSSTNGNTFDTTPEGVDVDEVVDTIHDKIAGIIKDTINEWIDANLPDIKEDIENYIEDLKNDWLYQNDTAPVLPSIAKDNNFRVLETGNDYVAFQVNINEGTPSSEWNTAYTNDVNYGYNPNTNLIISADETQIGSTTSTPVKFIFEDKTWSESGYMLPESNDISLINPDTQLADDNVRTHNFSLIGVQGVEGGLVGNTKFDNLHFDFTNENGNPYTYSEDLGYDLTYDTGVSLIQNIVNNKDVLLTIYNDTTPENREATFAPYISNLLYDKYEADAVNNTIVSDEDEDCLFETTTYNRPVITSTFKWTNVTSDSATFSFSYIIDDPSTDEDIFLDFHPEDVVLLWNKDGSKANIETSDDDDSQFTLNEAYEQDDESSGFNKGHVTLGEPEKDTNPDDIIESVSYNVTGLDSHTTYEDFAIYLKTDDSEWAMNDWSNNGSGSQIINYSDSRIFFIPTRFKLETPRDISFYINIIIALLVVLIFLLILVGIWYFWIWWKKHMSLSIFFEAPVSTERGEFILNLLHVRRNEKLWSAHESDLFLRATDHEIEAEFYKTSSVVNGLRIKVTADTGAKDVALSILTASKYNKYFIGIRGEEEEYHAQVVSDSHGRKIMNMQALDHDEMYEKAKNSLLEDSKVRAKAKKLSKREDDLEHGEIVSTIHDDKSTQTSLRYQVLLPLDHELNDEFKEGNYKGIIFYHLFNGKLYKLKHEYAGKFGTLYEYDIVGLEPDHIYVGLSISLDGGKTIFPSSALFGMTKNEDDDFSSKTTTKLGLPKPKTAKAHDLWPMSEVRKHLTLNQIERMFTLITKKHYEYDNPEQFLEKGTVESYYDDYINKWIVDDTQEESE